MTKIYGIKNTTEASYKFQVGNQKLFVKCVFTGGTVNQRINHPAQLVTTNPIVMRAVEESQLFKNGRIFLLQQIEDEPVEVIDNHAEEDSVTPEETVPVSAPQGKEYPEVKKHGEAVNILMEYGIGVSQCKNIEDTLAAAASVGVSFPNLKPRG